MGEVEKKEINLLDVIDVNFLQEFQDYFAKVMGVASLTIGRDGAITKPSNFTEFCTKYIRTCKEGCLRCNASDTMGGETAAKMGKPFVYTCHSGLTDFAVPIIVGGEHVASIYGGQVLTEKPNEENFRKLAKELGVDEEAFMKSLKKIKVISKEKVEEAANFLYLVANSFSQIAYNNLQLIKNNEREVLFKKVIETIRSNFDIGEICQTIVTTVGEVLGADRCIITDFDMDLNRFLPIENEYLSSDKISSCKGQDVHETVPDFIDILKQGKTLLVQNRKIIVDDHESDFELEQQTFEKCKVSSLFAVPLFYQDVLLGVLSVHYVDREYLIGDFERDLMTDIAAQTAIAMHQAKLYKITQMQAEKEKIVADIISKSIQAFDINEIKYIVKDIGILMNADRCYFVEVDIENMKGIPIEYKGEYLSSDKVKSVIGYDFKTEDVKVFVETYLEKKDVVFFDYEKIIEENIEEYNGIARYAKYFDMKYAIGIPLFNEDVLTAVLAIEYSSKKALPKSDELEFLRTLGKQASMVYNQIKLYQSAKKTAERETILRKLVEAARSSLDINDVKKKIAYEVGTAFGADRCYFRSYLGAEDKFQSPDSEYLSSPEIKAVKTSVSDYEALKYFANEVEYQKKGFYPVMMNQENTKGTPLEFYMKENELKLDCALPIVSRNDELIWLTLHFCKNEPKFSEEDKKLMETIAYQTDIAFEQIRLYSETKKNAEREALIKRIMDKIRSSLEIEEILTFICEEIAKLFDVQRVTVVHFYDPENYENYIIRREYKVDSDLKGLESMEYSKKAAAYWNYNLLSPNDILVFDNIPESDTPDYFKECYESLGVKSMIGAPIKKGDKQWGTLVLSQYETPRRWSNEEKELLKMIASQVYIALNQAELYDKLKKTTANQNAMLNNMPFMAWLKDLNSKLLAVNKTYAKILNLSVEEIKGKTDLDLFPKEYAQNYLQEDNLVIKTKETLSSVDMIVTPDGEKWHETFKSPVLDEIGNVIGTVGISQDITERKMLEMAILENKNRLNAILDNIPYWAWIKDRESKFVLVNKKLAQDSNINRDDFVGKTDYDIFPAELAESYVKDDMDVMTSGIQKTFEEKTVVNGQTRYLESFKRAFLSSSGQVIGTLGIAKDITERKEFEVELLNRQEKIIKSAERESALRRIVDIIRSSLDINEVKEKLVTETAKYFNADRCFIYESGKSEIHGVSTEYTSSDAVKKMLGDDFSKPEYKYMENLVFGNNNESPKNLYNFEKYIEENNLINTPVEEHMKMYDIKSSINLPILYGDDLYGVLVVHYTKNIVELCKDDEILIKNIADQAAIAIHQAKLYKITQLQAESEKMSRNLIEILRSSIDKSIIKKLFVRNIGKYFDADRVLLSEFDPIKGEYLPVDEDSEYLSSDKEKSFIGYDWNQSQAREYIQFLLEKRELKIYSWDEYIKQNPKGQDFIDLFVDADVKSSYNFPVLYQQSIMGFFCIEFTRRTFRLSDEDIARIRSICTQTGIALYHAQLYLQAQQCINGGTNISEVFGKIEEPVNEILDTSKLMSENEFERGVQIEYLNHIILACNKLLELTKDVSE